MASSANARIARNTAMLYVRMILLILISLYTVRVTLEALGAMDYGIYNVVANIVASLNFLMATMSSAVQRFLAYHLGRNDYRAYSRAFSLLLWGFVLISVAVIIIAEAVGPWFLNDILVIPPSRLEAAKEVYQFTILTFVASVMTVPYNAQIVANEKMGVYAYFSIAEGVMRLGVVFILLALPHGRLVWYGALLAVQGWIMWSIYVIYCRRRFPFCKVSFVTDRALAREIGSYAGWNLFGSISGMLVVQGQGILLNMFFGPLVNTAKAIADKVYSTVINFSINFFMAVSPQIVKSYAAGDVERMMQLGLKSSKFSFFLLVALGFPLICGMKEVLSVWLGADQVNPTMTVFSQLLLVYALIVSLEPPITQMIRATGRIRDYQVKVGVCTLMYIPIAALVLWLGGGPTSTLVTLIVLFILVLGLRVLIARKEIGLSLGAYWSQVAFPALRVSGVLAAVYEIFGTGIFPEGSVGGMLRVGTGFVTALAVIWWIGLDGDDRGFVLRAVASRLPGLERIKRK
ncbi:MAG: lipopolysaccharide biosynthesis protein [Bacteroides sp.]|nr:lipopolysaccharide biosynthesis protein [Bacteroides sp.]